MAAEFSRVPVWLWLPGATEPVEAAGITATAWGNRWLFTDSYFERKDSVSPDPRQLHLSSSRKGTAVLQKDSLGKVRSWR